MKEDKLRVQGHGLDVTRREEAISLMVGFSRRSKRMLMCGVSESGGKQPKDRRPAEDRFAAPYSGGLAVARTGAWISNLSTGPMGVQ